MEKGSIDIYQTCFELAKAICIVLDPKGNILEINQQGCRLLGFAKAEIVGQNWFERFLPTRVRDEMKAAYLAVMAGQETAFNSFENTVVTRADNERRILWHNTFLVDKSSRIGAISIGEDVTTRRQTELERDRFFNLSLDMLCICDFSGYFKDVNPAFSRTLGWPREKLLAEPFMTLVHPDDVSDTQNAMAELLGGSSVFMFNNRFKCLDGTYKWLSWNSFPLPEEHLIFAVARDINERRVIEQHLKESRDQLYHFEKLEAVGRLAGGIAHDFNNQLASIMGCADLLQDAVCNQPELKKYTDIILSAAEYSAKLTNELLAFARKGKYRCVSVNLHELIDQVLAISGRGMDDHILVTTDLCAADAVVKGDPSQLRNALLNVVINARDAMPDGGRLHIATSNTAGPDTKQNPTTSNIKVIISDTGVGMSNETKNHVFEPFFSTKKGGKGRGLGLASVYGTITNHSGAISVSSTEGNGSVFTFTFQTDTAVSFQHQPPVETTTTAIGTILLVDDEETVLEMVDMMLKSLKYNVLTCTNGPDALTLFKTHSEIDFVILDLVMPDWNGIKTFAELKKVNPNVKVLLSSGYAIEIETKQMLDFGAVGFLKKPFRKQELKDAIAPLNPFR